MAGKFEMYKDKRGEFRFRLKATNGQIILASEGYKGKPSALNGIESVRKTTKSGQFMFNLKATNGQVIRTSESYKTEKSRENGVQSVMKNAPDATLVDQTV